MRSLQARADALKGIDRVEARPAYRVAGQPPLDSGALFTGGREVVITHGAEIHRLRVTRQSKLILTK